MNADLMLIVAVIMFTIMLVGWLTGRRLPESGRKQYFSQFAAVATVVFCIYLFWTAPFISSISYVSFREYEYPKDLATTEAVAKQTQQQYRRIEDLEEEVKSLRADLYSLNDHYRFLMFLVLMGTSSFILKFAFPNRNEKISDTGKQ